MDGISFLMALTLASAGIFLCRDYARFLKGTYALSGQVKTIQQVFRIRPDKDDNAETEKEAFVSNGFYPVIEYILDNQRVAFTAIDRDASGQLHIGDSVRLRFTKSRRRVNRGSRMVSVLIAMLCILSIGLMSGALSNNIHISVSNVILASLTIAVSLAILALYVRDKDEYYIHDIVRTRGGRVQLCLFEPTAFGKWQSALKDPAQLFKIRSSQAFGATCMCAACVIFLTALEPFWRMSL